MSGFRLLVDFVIAELKYVIALCIVHIVKFSYRINPDVGLVYRLPAFTSVTNAARESTLPVCLTSTIARARGCDFGRHLQV